MDRVVSARPIPGWTSRCFLLCTGPGGAYSMVGRVVLMIAPALCQARPKLSQPQGELWSKFYVVHGHHSKLIDPPSKSKQQRSSHCNLRCPRNSANFVRLLLATIGLTTVFLDVSSVLIADAHQHSPSMGSGDNKSKAAGSFYPVGLYVKDPLIQILH